MKQKILTSLLHRILRAKTVQILLFCIGFSPIIAQTTTARGAAKNTPKAAVTAPFVLNATALKKLQTQVVAALNTPNERNYADCLLSDADITAWLANFTTPENNNKTAQKAAFERMAQSRVAAKASLARFRGANITAVLTDKVAQYGDPEQRTKAVLVTLTLKNASEESIRFYAADCGGRYKLLSVK